MLAQGMGGVHHILVVDDDRDVREAIAAAVASPGYIIHIAVDAYEAVRVLVDHAAEIIVTDVRMPGMNGFELARQAKLMRPYIHVIYMTGFYTGKDETEERWDGLLLFKPVRVPDLRRAISRELAQETAT
jgi:CheY-like chemotaxis protein